MIKLPFSLGSSTAMRSLINGKINIFVNGKSVMNMPLATSHPIFSFDVPLVTKYAEADDTPVVNASFD